MANLKPKCNQFQQIENLNMEQFQLFENFNKEGLRNEEGEISVKDIQGIMVNRYSYLGYSLAVQEQIIGSLVLNMEDIKKIKNWFEIKFKSQPIDKENKAVIDCEALEYLEKKDIKSRVLNLYINNIKEYFHQKRKSFEIGVILQKEILDEDVSPIILIIINTHTTDLGEKNTITREIGEKLEEIRERFPEDEREEWIEEISDITYIIQSEDFDE